LLADVTLAPMLVGLQVVTEAPAAHPTPYISMALRSRDWSTATEDGQEVMVDMNVWHEPASQTPETATAAAIMGHCRRILHTEELSLAAPFHAVQARVDNMLGPFRDPDGATLHGVVSLRVLVDHT
jgi:hypothetical protein